MQTQSFRYNASVKNGNNILRYESSVGHRPLPHKHSFDTFGDGGETEVTDYDRWGDVPTLGAVIKELREWYDTNRPRLS